MNIYKNAVMIQNASNPSGVCHTIFETIQHLRDNGESTENNPALALMVYQLAYLTGANRFDHDFEAYQKAYEECKAKSENNN